MTQVRDFVLSNFKVLLLVVSFGITIYIQHINNITQIAELRDKYVKLDLKLQDQYERIDKIKLDKVVFEATMSQFNSIQADIREMRSDIKELLQSRR